MKKAVILILIIFLNCLMNCSSTQSVSPGRPAYEEEKTYLDCFNEAKNRFNNNDFDEAEALLEKCLELNPGYSPASILFGDIYLAQNQLEMALVKFQQALSQNAYSVTARTGIGRIYLNRGDLDRALDEFENIIKIEPNNPEPYFYKGVILNQHSREFLSVTSFVRAINLDESYRKTVEEIIPITDPRISKLFKNEFLQIENTNAVTRSDVAALIGSVFNTGRVYNEGPEQFKTPDELAAEIQNTSIGDVPEGHWAYDEIILAVNSGLIELFPDGAFKPDQIVIKADFASVLQKITVRLTNDRSLLTKYIGENSPYNDLNSSHWAYPSVRLAVVNEYMTPRSNNTFGIGDQVNGLTAINALTKAAKLK
ncbi:MAG: tetratricopeptide repeat protein [bacterium]|nr:tetratricopeptide repeat protein [bacterium]